MHALLFFFGGGVGVGSWRGLSYAILEINDFQIIQFGLFEIYGFFLDHRKHFK